MMTLFLELLEQKIAVINREGSRSIEKFTDFLMALMSEKVLNVPNTNFI